MNTILRKLTNECYENDLDYFYKKVGNYSIKRNKDTIFHYYYGLPICRVYLNQKYFVLDHCGYSGYRLTTAQLNYLKKFYELKNFKLRSIF